MVHRPASRCPDPKCKGTLTRDEYGIFCSTCGAETETWAEPADADLPVTVDESEPVPSLAVPTVSTALRRSRTGLKFVTAAALLLVCGIGAWQVHRSSRPVWSASLLTTEALVSAIKRQQWPAELQLPAYYADPELFLLKRYRVAQSSLVVYWNAQSRAQKLDLLRQLGELQSPFAVPLLGEIAWFTLPTEGDREIASLLLGALVASSHAYVDVAIYVCDFVSQTAQFPEVSEYAAESSTALLDRRRRLGY